MLEVSPTVLASDSTAGRPELAADEQRRSHEGASPVTRRIPRCHGELRPMASCRRSAPAVTTSQTGSCSEFMLALMTRLRPDHIPTAVWEARKQPLLSNRSEDVLGRFCRRSRFCRLGVVVFACDAYSHSAWHFLSTFLRRIHPCPIRSC